ncbi:hypothetical protein [Bradyrhizobium embrapense]|uniref:hypothetical protein n=1 Tax=Bradyrhizobium embrapense TaxID=630921 RepID=UPI000B20C6CB|nr:hypothetical protein [Bradyrhizobium embrapense]
MTRSGVLLAGLILAHSWYPPECCSDGDCRAVPCEQISTDPRAPGQIVYGDHAAGKEEIRQSPDGQCHVCARPSSWKMFCVWMPKDLTS